MAYVNIAKFPVLYSDLVEKAWEDQTYLAKLHENPIAVLADAGIPVQAGAVVNVVMRKLDRTAKLADQVGAWEDGIRTGIYDLILPIRPEGGDEALIVQGPEGGDPCCCCPCSSC